MTCIQPAFHLWNIQVLKELGLGELRLLDCVASTVEMDLWDSTCSLILESGEHRSVRTKSCGLVSFDMLPPVGISMCTLIVALFELNHEIREG